MRPSEHGNLTLSVRRDEGRIKVVVDALDKENQFLNFLQIQGSVLDPDLKPSSVELVQTSPGRYEGTIENAEASGNYFVSLRYRGADNTQGVISTGISVPYSDEYRELRSNPTTLENLASLTDGQVVQWKTTNDGRPDMLRTLAGADHFRRDPGLIIPRSFAPLWPTLLWLAACLFLGDVAVRRIAPDMDRIKLAMASGWNKLRGHEVTPSSDYMDKLRTRKAEVGEQIERSRFASQFEAPAKTDPKSWGTAATGEALLQGEEPVHEQRRSGAGTPESPGAGLAPDAQTQEKTGYTDRLLKAKQRVWEEREKEKDKRDPQPGT
jgi:hypothetical protein